MMNENLTKIIALLLILIGESIAIYAEISGAKLNSVNNSNFAGIFIKMFLIISLSGVLLLLGYILGFSSFKNIWIISVISITAIIIVEPIIAYAIFKQFPTIGAIIGFALGVAGILFSIFY